MKKHIPNTITLLNLLAGFFAVVAALTGDPLLAGWLVVLASVFDFFDGFMARLLKAYSELGKQLDSLADLVSFGVAPAAVLYSLISRGGAGEDLSLLYLFAPALVVGASALRLARFNIDPSQESSFRGLPTPASGLFFATLPHLLPHLPPALHDPRLLSLTALLFALLMTSRIPLFSLKIKPGTSSFREMLPPILLLAIALPLLILFNLRAIPGIIILYIFMALVANLFNANTKKTES